MGRFAKLMGKLEFKIKDEEIVLSPVMGDNRKLFKIMNNKDLPDVDRMEQINDLICELLINSYPNESPEELRQVVEFNLNDFTREVLIGFGWTSRDKWDKLEGDAEKKLMSVD